MFDTNEEKATTVSNDTTASTETKSVKPAKPAKKSAPKKPHVTKPAAKKPAAKKPAKKTASKPSKKAVKPVKVKKASKPAKKASKPAAKKPAKKAGKRTADNFDRNFGRIRFNGESYSKGRAVHAVITAYAEKKKPTAAQLQSAFPDELLKNYGIVREASKARQYNVNGKTRFFVDSADLIKTKDGKSFAVCNQFSTENVKPFIKHAKSLGFTMTTGK